MKKITVIALMTFFCLHASAQWGSAGWYRVHNTNNSSNKNIDSFISVVGDQSNFDTGNTDQRWFYGCIKMRKPGEEISDPGTVIYLNQLGNSAVLSTQGVSTKTITGQYLSVSQNGTVDGKPVYSPYKSVLIYTMYLQVVGDLLDPGRQDTYAKYWLEPLTEANRNTYYFGVKPLNENIKDKDGYYWTTLYAGFAFKIPNEGGVEGAYTIEAITDDVCSPC